MDYKHPYSSPMTKSSLDKIRTIWNTCWGNKEYELWRLNINLNKTKYLCVSEEISDVTIEEADFKVLSSQIIRASNSQTSWVRETSKWEPHRESKLLKHYAGWYEKNSFPREYETPFESIV